VLWIINSELLGGSTHLSLNEQALNYVLAHMGLWGPKNLVALCVAELDDTLPHLWMPRRDSVGPPTDSPVCGMAWKMALGRGRTRPDSLLML
jgi:hypothetical protein